MLQLEAAAVGGWVIAVADVDGKAETVLVPVFGTLVPFHISMIKNISKTEEAGVTYMRVNFVAPTAAGANVC